MRVDAQGQARGRVAGESLDDLDRGLAHRQGGDERVPQGVEVGEPARFVLVGDPGGFEVGLDQEVRVPGQVAEDRRAGRFPFEPRDEELRQVGADWLRVVAATFRVGGGNRDGRRRSIEVERPPGQRPDFTRPKPRPQGDPVEHRPVGSAELEDDPTGFGGPDQAGLLGGR